MFLRRVGYIIQLSEYPTCEWVRSPGFANRGAMADNIALYDWAREKEASMEIGQCGLACTGDSPLPFIVGGIVLVAIVVLVAAFFFMRRR